MMMSLFSMFDPCSGFFQMNWLFFYMFFMFFFKKKYFLLNGKKLMLQNRFELILLKDLKEKTIKKNYKMMIYYIIIWEMILLFNLMGILPYVFAMTSHLFINLMFAMPIWMSLFMVFFFKKNTSFYTSLVPLGTPQSLLLVMAVIETISLFLRPLTLTVRLTANIVAGHIMLSLLSSMVVSSMPTFSLLFLVMVLLTLVEFGVSFIQSYVFILLCTLYIE